MDYAEKVSSRLSLCMGRLGTGDKRRQESARHVTEEKQRGLGLTFGSPSPMAWEHHRAASRYQHRNGPLENLPTRLTLQEVTNKNGGS
jgi:hypothetical protein